MKNIHCLSCKKDAPHERAMHHSGEKLWQCLLCFAWRPHGLTKPMTRPAVRGRNPVNKVYTVKDIPESPVKRFVDDLLEAYSAGGMEAARTLGSEIMRREKMTLGEASAMANYFAMGKKELYDAGLNEAIARDRAKNPVPLSIEAQKKKAQLLYQNFTGHKPGESHFIDKPVLPDVLSVIGDIDGILYTTIRDGKTEKYIHKFKKNSRPLFCVSPDGLSIHVIGGSYEFGERGIIDK